MRSFTTCTEHPACQVETITNGGDPVVIHHAADPQPLSPAESRMRNPAPESEPAKRRRWPFRRRH